MDEATGLEVRHDPVCVSYQDELDAVIRPRTSASLRKGGLSKHLLDGPRFRRSTPGRYVPAAVALSPAQRIAEAAAPMPAGAALGGWAAGSALGADRLDGPDRRLQPQPVVMCVRDSLHRASTPAVRYVRQKVVQDDLVDLGGISFTGAVRTAADLACWAADEVEAVVVLDVLLAAGVLDATKLRQVPSKLARRRGAAQAGIAVGLARAGVRSPGESRLRMAYVLGVGAPIPLVNPRVTDDGGFFLGIPDLPDVEAGLVLEYDGGRWLGTEREAGHRDREQHREDNVREGGLERTGLVVARAGRRGRQVALPGSGSLGTGKGYRWRTTVAP